VQADTPGLPASPGSKAPPRIVTFGCRLNAAESEAIRERLETAGQDGTDVVIVNSCAVTAEAVRQARQAIRKARRDNPAARVIVTGCAAQIDPDSFAAMPEVTRVLGNMEKLEARNFRLDDGANTHIRVNDIMAVRETATHLLNGFAERARAFVEVQTGCDHRCTFCVIPYGRGPARSAPAGLVVDRVRALVDAGFNEVVLTGVDITSYGADLPGRPTLGTLVQRILTLVPGLPRLRLSSLDMIEIDTALFDALEDTRLMPHLHLSLQSGDDMILKRMKRRHSAADAVAFVAAARKRRAGIAFGADLIAGFPTETEAMFENTLAIVEACDLVHLHVFPYSARQGTPAARMPQVASPVRKERAARLRALGASRLARYLATQQGATHEVLVETGAGAGHTPHFCAVQVAGAHAAGTLVRARITGSDGQALQAVAA